MALNGKSCGRCCRAVIVEREIMCRWKILIFHSSRQKHFCQWIENRSRKDKQLVLSVKMSINLGPRKQAQKAVLSRKVLKPVQTPLIFSNNNVFEEHFKMNKSIGYKTDIIHLQVFYQITSWILWYYLRPDF